MILESHPTNNPYYNKTMRASDYSSANLYKVFVMNHDKSKRRVRYLTPEVIDLLISLLDRLERYPVDFVFDVVKEIRSKLKVIHSSPKEKLEQLKQ